MNWLAIVIAGVATYLARASFIAFGDGVQLPPIVESSLRFVGPAAFAAISLPIVLGGDALADFSSDIPRLIAAGLAAAVIWKTRSVPLSLITGMGTLWLLLWIL